MDNNTKFLVGSERPTEQDFLDATIAVMEIQRWGLDYCEDGTPLLLSEGNLALAALKAGYAMAASGVSSPGGEAGGWVPVGERLPEFVPGTEYSPRVLAFGDGGIDGPQFVAYYAAHYGWYLAHDNQPNMKVTHWMPLAPAPQS